MDAINLMDTSARDRALPFAEEGGSHGNGDDGPAPSSGTVFVLAAGGVRHMGRPWARVARGGGFLGYPPEDLFWRDLLDLVHPADSQDFEALISDVKASPGASVSVEVRLLDGLGRWRPAEATVMNVLEAPDGLDGGLLVVNVRAFSARKI